MPEEPSPEAERKTSRPSAATDCCCCCREPTGCEEADIAEAHVWQNACLSAAEPNLSAHVVAFGIQFSGFATLL